MTEFEKQLAARIQAIDFLLNALLRAQFHAMTTEEARKQVEALKEQFAHIRLPPDMVPMDVQTIQSQHADAQHFLDRTLRQVAPQAFE